MNIKEYVTSIATTARAAGMKIAVSSGKTRNAALVACAKFIRDSKQNILRANQKDLDLAKQSLLSEAMIKRLELTDSRVEAMAYALEEIALQADPVGNTISASNRPNGLRVEKRRVPIGLVGIIFESRPNVTSDAAGLCIKAGNACILRGGKEAINSNIAIASAMQSALASVNLPPEAITLVDTTDREVVGALASATGLIDVIIPRGGKTLINTVVEAATIPVIKHFDGICHIYVHASADLPIACDIVINAKTQYPAVCNAAETLLIDASIAREFLPNICQKLLDRNVELRLCEQAIGLLNDEQKQNVNTNQNSKISPACEDDWSCEYLNLTLSIKIVTDISQAIDHINTYGSGHTDAIVASDINAANQFITKVDSACVMVNASTRFSDGGQLGLGAEIGISTDKIHARGPMGAQDLTTYKWIVTGSGHIR